MFEGDYGVPQGKDLKTRIITEDAWRENIDNREIVVWGVGRDAPLAAREIEKMLDNGSGVSFFVSRDWETQNEFLGKKVLGKNALNREKHFVVIGTTQYEREVVDELKQQGYSECRDFVQWEVLVHYRFSHQRSDITSSESNYHSCDFIDNSVLVFHGFNDYIKVAMCCEPLPEPSFLLCTTGEDTINKYMQMRNRVFTEGLSLVNDRTYTKGCVECAEYRKGSLKTDSQSRK